MLFKSINNLTEVSRESNSYENSHFTLRLSSHHRSDHSLLSYTQNKDDFILLQNFKVIAIQIHKAMQSN